MHKYRGVPVSNGIAHSKAVIINGIDDYKKVNHEDIIVVNKSYPGWIIPLINASGIIVEIGGKYSHIGIVCRELGKPCVSNIPDICNIIHDGDEVLINGDTGEVNVVNR